MGNKTEMIQFRVTPQMKAAIRAAVERMRRTDESTFLREDCLRPTLQELGLWPGRRLVDRGGRYHVEDGRARE